MSDKMKCPFCGAELKTDNEMARLILWRCHTPGCLLNGWHNAEIIQALIDGKKAQDALKIATEAIDILYDAIRHNNAKETSHIADYVLKFASEQRQILKEITH